MDRIFVKNLLEDLGEARRDCAGLRQSEAYVDERVNTLFYIGHIDGILSRVMKDLLVNCPVEKEASRLSERNLRRLYSIIASLDRCLTSGLDEFDSKRIKNDLKMAIRMANSLREILETIVK